MDHSLYPDRRISGLPYTGPLPWGSHFCQFYRTRQDLLDVLVPFFRAGLENNEYCLWVTSGVVRAEDARKALAEAVPGFESLAEAGRIEFVPSSRWRTRNWKSGKPILSALDKAVFGGFDGVRFSCEAFPDRDGGKGHEVPWADVVGRNHVIAAFTYPRDSFDAPGLMEVVRNHRFALVRGAGGWEVIESSEAWTIKDDLRRSEEKLRSLFSNMSEGFAFHRIVLDGAGSPADYVFLQVNAAFERLTGLKARNIIGKRATVVIPGIEKDRADWIRTFGEVALTGMPVQVERHSESLGRWYKVSAFTPLKGYFAVTFSDITERKAAEEGLRRAHDELDARVQERTAELAKVNRELETEIAERRKGEVELLRHREHLEDLVRERTAQLERINDLLHGEIAERGRAEEALKAALADKDLLMRELAHRTKNNMQVIGSLLGLQAAASTDEKFLSAVSDTQDRILAMALVHENLYQSGNIASLDIKDYVQDLMKALLRVHRGTGGEIRPNLEMDEIYLSIDAALPCGLIVNELVSNSLKHAFAGGKAGNIHLSLRRNGDRVELRYRDDGPGLPPGLDLARVQSLGLKLVYNLAVRQLRGTMEILRDGGAGFVFTFHGFSHLERS